MTKNNQEKIQITLGVLGNVPKNVKEKQDAIASLMDVKNSSSNLLSTIIKSNDNILCDNLNFTEYEKVLPAVIIALIFIHRSMQFEMKHECCDVLTFNIIGSKDRLLWRNKIQETCKKFFPSLDCTSVDDGNVITIFISFKNISKFLNVEEQDESVCVSFDGCKAVDKLLQTNVWTKKAILVDLPEKCWGNNEKQFYDDVESLLDALTSTNRSIPIFVGNFKREFQQKCFFHHIWSFAVCAFKLQYSEKLDRCIFMVKRIVSSSTSGLKEEVKNSD